MIEWGNLSAEEKRRLIGWMEVHLPPVLVSSGYAAQAALDLYNEARLIHAERAKRSGAAAQLAFEFANEGGRE